MRGILIFLIGFQFGTWCQKPENIERAYKAGVWTRGDARVG